MADYAKSEAKEYARTKLRGAISAICLPEKNGEVDEAGLRSDIRHCLDVIDARGLYIHGYYGNFWLLTNAERKAAIEVVVDEAEHSVPVICRCAHACMRDVIDLVRHAEAAGADMISLLGPQLGQASEDMVYRWFELIAAETNLGITLFNTTQAGYVMSPQLLARISEIENIAALKNHLPAEHTNEVRRLVGESIVVVDPEEETFVESILEHGQGAIYTGTNYMFDGSDGLPMRDYVDAALDGDASLARERFAALTPLRDLHHKWVVEPWQAQGLCPISTVKLWSELRGMSGGAVREPLVALTSEQRDALEHELEVATRQTFEAAV